MKGGNDEMLRHDPAIANLQNRLFLFQIVIIKDLLRKKFLEMTQKCMKFWGGETLVTKNFFCNRYKCFCNRYKNYLSPKSETLVTIFFLIFSKTQT